jgi:protein-tyrosine phosphatase
VRRRFAKPLLTSTTLAVILSSLSITGFAGGGGTPIATSPDEILATRFSSNGPILMPGVALDNLGVIDGRIYRGEQPKRQDYVSLAGIGVKTIIDLRADARSTSRAEAEAAGLHYINIPIKDSGTPNDEQAAAFLKAVEDPANGVVYVHCAGGRHRTGSMLAVYRMVHDNWTVDKAYEEMLAYDFYTRNGHKGFKTFVFDFYQRREASPATCSHPADSAETTDILPPPPVAGIVPQS